MPDVLIDFQRSIWVVCGACDRRTTHKVLSAVMVKDRDPYRADETEVIYMIAACQGCHTASFCIETTDYGDYEYDTDGPAASHPRTHELFPRRIAGRAEMKSANELPAGVLRIYRETRAALCADQPILAGVGIRAILEAVCKDRGAAGKSLEDRIDALAAMKFVTEDGAKILHSLRFMGNQAAHEVKAHDVDELGVAFSVVEYVLHGVYVMPKQAAKLPGKGAGA